MNKTRAPKPRHRSTLASKLIVGASILGLLSAHVMTGTTAASAATKMPSATVNPNSVTLSPGSSANLAVTLSSNRPTGFKWALQGRPTTVSASMTCPTLRSCVVVLRAAAQAGPWSGVMQLQLSSGSSVRSLPIALRITGLTTTPPPPTPPPTAPASTVAPPNRTLAIQPINLIANARPGARATFPITVVRDGGNDPVNFTIASLPADWRAAFLPNPSLGASTFLIIDTSAGTATGDYPIRVTARLGSLAVETLLVVRLRTSEFSLTLLTPPAVVHAGSSSSFTVETRSLDGSTEPISLRTEGLPPGVTASISPNPSIGTVTVTLNAASGVAAVSSAFSLIGARAGGEARLSLGLVVIPSSTSSFRFTATPVPPVPGESPGYGISASAASLAVVRGSIASFDLTITPKGGFSGPIDLALSTPSGWSVLWSTVGTNVLRATIAVPAGAATGSAPLALTTSSGSLIASLSISASVS